MRALLAFLAVVPLAGCELVEFAKTPEARAAAETAGRAAVEAYKGVQSGNWEAAGAAGAAAVAAAIGIVRIWRGSVNARKGTPPTP